MSSTLFIIKKIKPLTKIKIKIKNKLEYGYKFLTEKTTLPSR